MNNKSKIYLAAFLFVVFGFIYLETIKKKPVNWFPSYVAKHKMPYGTFVLKQELKNLFPDVKIKDIAIPPYTFLADSTEVGTYVFIDEALNFGDAEFLRLMEFVKRGNDVFISTHGMNIDTLNFETEELLSGNFEENIFFKLKNKAFNREYSFDRPMVNQVFTKMDTVNTTILGITGYSNSEGERTEGGINFVKHRYGKGTFYLHTFPELFTNYNILKSPNQQHTANVLSYIKSDKPILWDSYYKTGKSKISSPIYYLLNSKYLKWAYYMALIGVLFFIIFEGKRKQRNIPIITPLKNQTIAFTQTIANMYFEKQEHKNIAEHKISYLLEFVRLKLHIPTSKIDDTFYNFVASRSGNSYEDVEKLFKFCDEIHLKNQISNEELIQLNKMIEEFKKTTQYGK